MAKYTYHECEYARQAYAKVVITTKSENDKVHFFRNSSDAQMFFNPKRRNPNSTYTLYWVADNGSWIKMFDLKD